MRLIHLSFAVCLSALAVPAVQAQSHVEANRVTAAVNTAQRQTLHGHMPGWAADSGDLGAVGTDLALDHLTVVLARSAATQAAFEQLLEDQQNPGSPRYHQWLTPQQLGEQFGVSDHDITAVTQWLASQGLRVDAISHDRTRITFSGASGMVGRAFGTEFHQYAVQTRRGEEQRLSIHSEPVIPAALAPVIAAIHGLAQERAEPQNISVSVPAPAHALGVTAAPQLTGTSGGVPAHFIAPADFVTMFDIQPVYNAGFNGSGIKVAIIGRSLVNSADITTFQSTTGLSASAQPVTVIPTAGTNPGVDDTNGDQGEQTLDVNRVMSTAPGAEADLVVSKSSITTDGIDIALEYEVNTRLDPIMTVSYGSCELSNGSANVASLNSFFSAAAAEGITTFVSSGDSEAAGCNAATSTPPGTTPTASINALCSSPFVTCVGGTEPADTASPSTYWRSSNSSVLESAISYIPEGGWNEPLSFSNTLQIFGSGGGPSLYIAKPSFQTGTGVPADSVRDTPDVAFPSALHDGYYSCLKGSCAGGGFTEFGGTSAAAPGMAGVMALMVQKLGIAQGNYNPTLYHLAAIPSLGVFHDTTPTSSGVSSCSLSTASMCNNSTPGPSGLTGGLAGYAVTTGYDLVTGLGSIDVANLFTAASPSYTLTPASGTLIISSPGATTANTYSITATSVNSFAGTVPLTCTVAFSGSGSATDLPTCSLAPSSVVLTANSTAVSVVTIHTTAAQAGSNSGSKKVLFGAGGALACILLCLPLGVGKKRRGIALLAALLAVFALGGGLSGCGGGGSTGGSSNLGTTLGNYTVTVTGTFSSATTSTSFTVTVN